MTNNSRTNSLLKYAVMAVDFILLNALLYLCVLYIRGLQTGLPTK